MLIQTIKNVFSIKELRGKILFTLAMLAVYRIGFWIPVPGINQEELAKLFQNQGDTGALGRLGDFMSTFSGGDLSHSTIFGLGIMPYISSSIIFQLLASAWPALKKIQEEGPTGRQKIMEWTRYVTVALCIMQGIFWLGYMAQRGMVYVEFANSPLWWVMGVAALTAGTVFLMWLGEQIDKHGIGNGVSMIIMAGILARFPDAVQSLYRNFEPGEPDKIGYMGLIVLAAGFVGVVAGSVLMTVAQRRIPVQQAKHTRGRRVFGGQKSYLPLRLNHGGVMPIIFASSIMIFPSVIFSGLAETSKVDGGWFYNAMTWISNELKAGSYLHEIGFMIMIYFFSYFWITVQFNPEEMAKQMKEHGSFIPGLRPGPRTAEYLETVMTRITYVGAAFLCIIAVLPSVVNTAMNVDYSIAQFFGGTSLLIVVSVTLDFLQRVEAALLMRNYEGILSAGEETKGPRIRSARA
ncbi:MAG: preprotein translocase subunit SecY [Phycisphaerae bacterium]|nr:preprotein translocase subunit SecY [Phycisphaerae bacterium]